MNSETIITIIKENRLQELNDIFKDLAKIKEHIRMKVQNGTMMFYTIDGGETNNQVLAFKYYKKDVSEFFDHDLNDLDFVILNVKKLTKQLSLYEEYQLPLTFEFETEDGTDINSSSRMVKSLTIKNSKLKTFMIGGEPGLLRNLNIATILEKVDLRYRRYGFEMSVNDYNQVLDLISLDSTNEIVQIIVDKDIQFREKGWELQVGQIDDIKENMLFKKKFLNNFSTDGLDVVVFDKYETFFVLRGSDNVIMISLEYEE